MTIMTRPFRGAAIAAALFAVAAPLGRAAADTTTPNLGLTEPTVGASSDTWGGKLNANADLIDALFGSGPVLLPAKGGTGAGTAAGARTNLGAAQSGANNDITSLQQASVSRPNMPAFMAKLSGDLLNKTGNGATYTVIFGTASFDHHSDFNTATGTFTVPFTGLYQCDLHLTLTNVASDNNRFDVQIAASAGQSGFIDGGAVPKDANNRVGISLSGLFSWTAGTTVVAKVESEGHLSNNIGILSDGAGGSLNPASTFSCLMVA
jgi:hypothetical protein